eukprot:2176483-Amphidinium_carterae.1
MSGAECYLRNIYHFLLLNVLGSRFDVLLRAYGTRPTTTKVLLNTTETLDSAQRDFKNQKAGGTLIK